MKRREILKLLAGAATIPLLPRSAWALLAEAQQTAATLSALKVLTPQQDATVIVLAELILPETETPGAKTAGVDRFIDVMLGEWMEETQRAAFLQGLADLDSRSQAMFGKPFTDAAATQQIDLLKNLDEELAAWRDQRSLLPKNEDEPVLESHTFFALMKHLTLLGYFTSQAGAQKALHLHIIPETHNMCAPLAGKESS